MARLAAVKVLFNRRAQRLMRRIMWRVGLLRLVWRIGWPLAVWAFRSSQARRHSNGLIGRAAMLDRAVGRRVALALLPLPRWVIEVGIRLGGLRMWTLVCGALLWRWAGKRAVRAMARRYA